MNKKKSEKLLKAILDATRAELLTTQELCSRFRISTKSLNNWLREDKAFESEYRAAQSINLDFQFGVSTLHFLQSCKLPP